jgi:hypothetical protein
VAFGHKSSRSVPAIDFPKTKRLHDSAGQRSFSIQNLIEAGPFDAMTPRKRALISLTLNCGSQKLNNFVIIKYEQMTAHFGFVGKADSAMGRKFLSPGHVTRAHCTGSGLIVPIPFRLAHDRRAIWDFSPSANEPIARSEGEPSGFDTRLHTPR